MLKDQDFIHAANLIGCDPAAIRAVVEIESKGGGMLPNGEPKILFEGRWFSRFTEHRYDNSHPSISYRRWTKAHYKGGESEYRRLNLARALDDEAALKSASWGLFQIMGFNYVNTACQNVYQFVERMRQSEGEQLVLFVEFLQRYQNGKAAKALRNRDWPAFAHCYNGSEYRANRYDTKLAAAYARYSGDVTENGERFVTVQSGDTLSKIAANEMRGDLQGLLALNTWITNPDRINVGDRVRVA